MLGISVSKFHELLQVVVDKDPHPLHALLKETPLKFYQAHNITFGAEPIFFNDDSGRLTGTEQLFRGVRVAIIDPFFITCDNSDKSIIHGFTDKLSTDIISTLSLLKC